MFLLPSLRNWPQTYTSYSSIWDIQHQVDMENSELYQFLSNTNHSFFPKPESSTMQQSFSASFSSYPLEPFHAPPLQDKALAALRNHKEAEKRRRERINAHLNKLRTLLPCNSKVIYSISIFVHADIFASSTFSFEGIEKTIAMTTKSVKGWQQYNVKCLAFLLFFSERLHTFLTNCTFWLW